MIELAAGSVGWHANPCGVVGAYTCYIVVVGSSGDETTTGPLAFKLPSATIKQAAGVPNGYVDGVKAANFPADDKVTAQECDSTVDPATNLATNCDPATAITGTVSKSGTVEFTAKGVTVKDAESYEEYGGGSCPPGGTCSIVVSDQDNTSVYAVMPITLAP